MYLYKLQNSLCIYTPLQNVKSVTPILFFPQRILALEKGARWAALGNEDFCSSRAQEEGSYKPPHLACQLSPALLQQEHARSVVCSPPRLGKGAEQHPGDNGLAHPSPENKQKKLILYKRLNRVCCLLHETAEFDPANLRGAASCQLLDHPISP